MTAANRVATPETKWIRDKCNGKAGEPRPPAPPCWVPPCVQLCPGKMEMNALCRAVGKIGCVSEDKRVPLCRLGLFSSILTMVLYIVGAIAVSDTAGAVEAASYSKADLTLTMNDVTQEGTVFVGLRALSIRSGGVSTVVDFEDVCRDVGEYVENGKCDDCKDESAGLVFGAILAVITCLPNIFTDILRMYPKYDANCQKFWGVFMGLFGTVTSLATFSSYSSTCWKSFESGTILGEGGGSLTLEWSAGAGLICCVMGTFFKLVDVVVHLLIPTPAICRDADLQSKYEAGGEMPIEI